MMNYNNTINNYWKQLIKTDLTFNNLLEFIAIHGKSDKNEFVHQLRLSAKFELIRMESDELLEFKEGTIVLGKQPQQLVEFYLEPELKSAV